jgi:hypothetical protein
LVIADTRVSKHQLRIYSIIYEKNDPLKVPPLVYCEDLESINGTYVNGALIGRITHEKIGHLLCDGDLIEIKPLWKFRFHQTIPESVVRSRGEWDDLKVWTPLINRALTYGFRISTINMRSWIGNSAVVNTAVSTWPERYPPRGKLLAKLSI